MLLAIMVLAAGLSATAASAQEEAPSAAPQLGIQPADQPGSWYDLELDAGAIEHLSVELSNHGDEPLTVATYAADVYSLVGGGMGVALRDETTSGTTRWLDYRATTELLGPNEAVRRTVTVTVPDDVEPGQYLAALVIENDQPLAADGDLGVEHVIRQAIAVNITVPGPAAPALRIGDVEHIVAGVRSVTRLEIDNTGNRHLKPAGSLTLTNEAGDRLASLDAAMDSVYAGTTGHLEISLDELLAPGIYTIAAELHDSGYDVDAAGTASFEIVAPPLTERPIPGLDRVIGSIEAIGLPAWIVLTAIGLLLALLMLLVVAAARRRPGRRADMTTQPLAPSPTAVADPSPTVPPASRDPAALRPHVPRNRGRTRPDVSRESRP